MSDRHHPTAQKTKQIGCIALDAALIYWQRVSDLFHAIAVILCGQRFCKRASATLHYYFHSEKVMKINELSLLKSEALTDEELSKLQLVLAFHDQLPTEAMRQTLLVLMEEEQFMARSEFDRRLNQFVAHVKAVLAPFQESENVAHAASGKLH